MKLTLKIAPFLMFPAVVLGAHLLASKLLNLYMLYPKVDILFHFIGGFSIAWTATQILVLFQREQITRPMDGLVLLLLAVCLTTTAAVFWEFAEFGADQLFHTNVQISLANTMQDQFFGILGGVSWAVIYARYPRVFNTTVNR